MYHNNISLGIDLIVIMALNITIWLSRNQQQSTFSLEPGAATPGKQQFGKEGERGEFQGVRKGADRKTSNCREAGDTEHRTKNQGSLEISTLALGRGICLH